MNNALQMAPAPLKVFGIGLMAFGVLTSTGVAAPRSMEKLIVSEQRTGYWAELDAASRPYIGVVPAAEPALRVASSADQVRDLHIASGLTWDQIARVFGVSRRAVHLWANGGRLNAPNQQLLTDFLAQVEQLPGETSDDRRAQLLAVREGGQSIYERFRGQHLTRGGAIQAAAYSPDELIAGGLAT